MSRGFTLLEVMISLGILAVGLVAISDLNGGAVQMHAYSRKATVATLLLVLLGAGGGLALASGLALVADLAMPSRRGALSSVFYACAYVGFAAPFATAVLARSGGPTLPLSLGASLAALLGVRLAVRTLHLRERRR